MTKRIIAAAIACLVLAAAGLLAAAFAPTLFGYESTIVVSGSMGNAMPMGAVAITKMVDAKTIEVGDVVNFRHKDDELTTTHRVIGAVEQAGARVLTTKGDANATADSELLIVRGPIARVTWSVPFAGYLVRYARTPAGSVLLFGVPIVGLFRDKRRRARAARPSETVVEANKERTSLENDVDELKIQIRALEARVEASDARASALMREPVRRVVHVADRLVAVGSTPAIGGGSRSPDVDGVHVAPRSGGVRTVTAIHSQWWNV